MKSVFRITFLLVSMSLITACGAFNGDKWPRLDEGFELRPDIAASTPSPTPQQSQNFKQELAQQSPEVERLIAEIAQQRQKYDTAIEQLLSAASENKQGNWFTSQLELSRINSLKDELMSNAPEQTEVFIKYLANLNEFLEAASSQVANLEP